MVENARMPVALVIPLHHFTQDGWREQLLRKIAIGVEDACVLHPGFEGNLALGPNLLAMKHRACDASSVSAGLDVIGNVGRWRVRQEAVGVCFVDSRLQ